jgi:DNA-binding CsgD family transcriptional regulator
MLIGRDAEREAIDRLLAAARVSTSGVLLLRGEPGIGKTALLEHAAASAAGMTVLRARGVTAEAGLPFAGLSALLHPVIDRIDRLPAVQAASLRGALALGPNVASERLIIGAATLGLLAAAADAAPLCVLVDDLQWLDEPSRDAILFACRRLIVDPIGVLLTTRDDAAVTAAAAGLPAISIAGLDADSAARLLARVRGADVPREGALRLHRGTGGNPLALVELADQVDQIGADLIDAPLRVASTVESAFRGRISALSAGAQAAMLVAAAASTRSIGAIGDAAARLGLDLDALAEAERAGLLTIDGGRLEFRHPLVRSAISNAADPAARRAAHRALAETLDLPADADRRAWHLGEAAYGRDQEAADALAAAAARATARGAYAVAAQAAARAAELSATTPERAERLLQAASSRLLAGDTERAVGLLHELDPVCSGARIAVGAARLRARIAYTSGRALDAYDLLAAAARTDGLDPTVLAVLWAEAAEVGIFAGRPPAALAGARESVAAAEASGDAFCRCVARLALGMALVLSGDASGEGPRALREALAMPAHDELLRGPPQLLRWALIGALYLREADTGRDAVSRCVAIARDRGAAGVLSPLLQFLAHDAATTDRWAEATALFGEALQIADDTDQPGERAGSLAALARLEARQGRRGSCLEHAAEALELTRRHGRGYYETWTHAAFGDVELANGSPALAISHYAACDELLEELGIGDVDLYTAPDRVEAHVRLGDVEPVREAAAEYAERAAAKDQPWALARAARAAALLAGDQDFEARFEAALDLHRKTPDAFELARTQLLFGERLRRAQRRLDARPQLRAAFAAFERLGAEPWAERARLELGASGETARRRDPSTVDDLTPRELQVAFSVVAGATTRETAARLYLSAKTVEYHLRNIYRKLGVANRADLARALRPPD